MKKSIILLIILIIIGFAACTENSSPIASEEKLSNTVVVSAFLYANEPVYNIRLTSALLLGIEETSAPPINDAQVSLLKNGERYNLQPSQGDSGYYHYSGSDLSVNNGDKFTIEINHNNNIITGETTVPEPPAGVVISNDKLIVPDFSNFGFGFGRFSIDTSQVRITVNWEANGSDLFFTTLKNSEENSESIESGMPFMKGRFIISKPTTRNSYVVSFMNVTEYGRHCVKVYRVNQEYADLYYSSSQSSQDLNEPLTNINNGLGVFSAFSSDSIFFNVSQE